MRFVERYKGVESANQKARELHEKAVRLLDAFPESTYKSSLVDFANFVVTRTA